MTVQSAMFMAGMYSLLRHHPGVEAIDVLEAEACYETPTRAAKLHKGGDARVVLEAGGGGTSAEWSAVPVPLGPNARACAYDRAGLVLVDPTHESAVLGSFRYRGWVPEGEGHRPFVPEPRLSIRGRPPENPGADYMAGEFSADVHGPATHALVFGERKRQKAVEVLRI